MAIRDKQPPVNVPTPIATDVGTDGRILIPGIGGGGGGDKYLDYHQSTPASTWVINHNLGKNPSVITFDDAMPPTQWEGEVTYIDTNNLSITFLVNGVRASFGGHAYLN